MQITLKMMTIISLLTLTLMSAGISEDQKLLEKSKSLIFDNRWNEAIGTLDEVIEKHSKSSSFTAAVFYKAKCLQETGNVKGALDLYQKYIKTDKKGGFKEDAQIAVIDISFNLFTSGQKEPLKNIIQLLNSNTDLVAKYYAAFKLSYSKNKDISKLGLPVLKDIILNEEDPDLKNRAKIAILRIDPSSMKDVENKLLSKDLMVHFSIFNKETKQMLLNVSVPISLADLLVDSLDEKEFDIDDFHKDGKDIKKSILEKIHAAKTGILTFEIEDVIIKINIS